MAELNFPKISIITPVFNQVDFIEQTIRSVLEQKYPNLEYIIIDGGSTDGTLEILKKYESQITCLISEPDNGMYEALNKGFQISTGDIMAYINSDDIFLDNSFYNMSRMFNDLPEVEWIHAVNSFLDIEGKLTGSQVPSKFSFLKFLNYDFQWIQQESTFWRRSLWERAGGYIDNNLKYAGDFELWFRFFQYADLYVCSTPIGAWRKREGQLSQLYITEYLEEANNLIRSFLSENPGYTRRIKKANRIKVIIKFIQKINIFKSTYFEKRLNDLYGLNNLNIKFSEVHQRFKILR